jgi:hypothetical protein
MTRRCRLRATTPGSVENRDVHTYTGWRDTFDPNLVDLVQRVLQGDSYAA